LLWVAGICGAALLAWSWWAGRKARPLHGDELRRLRRTADALRREQFQPFD